MATERIGAKIAFFIDRKRTRLSDGSYLPRAVTAVFTDSGNFKMKDCYAHVGQHGTCAVDWVAENCRPAKYAEYKELYDELNGSVGYDIEVVDAEWWIAKTMDYFNAVQGNGKRDVEVEVHKCGENNPQENVPVAEAIEGVLDDAYEFVCNELDARGIPYDSSNTDKIFVNYTAEKKTRCINIFSSVCLAYEGK